MPTVITAFLRIEVAFPCIHDVCLCYELWQLLLWPWRGLRIQGWGGGIWNVKVSYKDIMKLQLPWRHLHHLVQRQSVIARPAAPGRSTKLQVRPGTAGNVQSKHASCWKFAVWIPHRTNNSYNWYSIHSLWTYPNPAFIARIQGLAREHARVLVGSERWMDVGKASLDKCQ